jgi:DNA-binding NtrC family response regulator
VSKLLIIDDEESLLYSLEAGLAAEGLEVITAATGREGIDAVGRHVPDAVILDVRLPDMTGLEALDRIKELDPRLPVVMITAFAATETAIGAVKRGAFEYLLKPVDLHHLREVVARAVELRRMRSVPTVFDGRAADADADEIVGRCPVMQGVYRTVGLLAPQDVPVLIAGESGTGKELIARAVYQHTARADKPLHAVNCAATPGATLEGELFGHEKGAGRRRVGKFEQAHGGTVFLDDIGEMAMPAQAKLLQILRERRFDTSGNKAVAADVRVIATTHQDLEALAAAGRFRRDLLYRLNGFSIALPPLRERPADILLLADYFLRRAARRLDKPLRAVAPEALRVLERHAWPGNVRELENVIRFAAIRSVGETITPDCLPPSLRGESPAGASDREAVELIGVRRLVRDLLADGSLDIYRRVMAEVERIVVGDVLRHAGGNQVQASELLGISRNTLRAKLQPTESASGIPAERN